MSDFATHRDGPRVVFQRPRPGQRHYVAETGRWYTTAYSARQARRAWKRRARTPALAANRACLPLTALTLNSTLRAGYAPQNGAKRSALSWGWRDI